MTLQNLKFNVQKLWIYLGARTCEVFHCFVTYDSSFYLFFFLILCFLCSTSLVNVTNLVPRASPLHAPGSERGETVVGAGHVSPREKLDPGRGASPASLCQDLLSTPKRGFRFAARSPHETHSTSHVFPSSLHFASY